MQATFTLHPSITLPFISLDQISAKVERYRRFRKPFSLYFNSKSKSGAKKANILIWAKNFLQNKLPWVKIREQLALKEFWTNYADNLVNSCWYMPTWSGTNWIRTKNSVKAFIPFLYSITHVVLLTVSKLLRLCQTFQKEWRSLWRFVKQFVTVMGFAIQRSTENWNRPLGK